MLSLTIDRKWKKEKYSIGRWYASNTYLTNSLENPDRGLTSNMSESEIKRIKVPGNTAIPLGTYQVVLSYSNKFRNKAWAKKYNGLVPEILGVKGFSGVRVHPLNYVSETDGCPGIGDNKTVGKLSNSVKRYYELMDNYIMPAWRGGELIMITIK